MKRLLTQNQILVLLCLYSEPKGLTVPAIRQLFKEWTGQNLSCSTAYANISDLLLWKYIQSQQEIVPARGGKRVPIYQMTWMGEEILRDHSGLYTLAHNKRKENTQ